MINFKYLEDVIEWDWKKKTNNSLFVNYFNFLKQLFTTWEAKKSRRAMLEAKETIEHLLKRINKFLRTSYEFEDFIEEEL